MPDGNFWAPPQCSVADIGPRWLGLFFNGLSGNLAVLCCERVPSYGKDQCTRWRPRAPYRRESDGATPAGGAASQEQRPCVVRARRVKRARFVAKSLRFCTTLVRLQHQNSVRWYHPCTTSAARTGAPARAREARTAPRHSLASAARGVSLSACVARRVSKSSRTNSYFTRSALVQTTLQWRGPL